MSVHPPEENLGPEPPRIEPESDPVSYPKVALGLLLVMAVFAAAVGVARWLQVTTLGPGEESLPLPAVLGQPEIHGVNQPLFRLDDRARRRRAKDAQRLRSYGVVDADAGLAHIPIEEAMERLIERTADAGPAVLVVRPAPPGWQEEESERTP
jgi:hypothetical protein